MHHNTSIKADTEAEDILHYLITSKVNVGKQKGDTDSFISHQEKQVELYNEKSVYELHEAHQTKVVDSRSGETKTVAITVVTGKATTMASIYFESCSEQLDGLLALLVSSETALLLLLTWRLDFPLDQEMLGSFNHDLSGGQSRQDLGHLEAAGSESSKNQPLNSYTLTTSESAGGTAKIPCRANL